MGLKWTEHTKELERLEVGDNVRMQNQTGCRKNKWDKSGVVVEDMGNRQYRVRVDGSGRLSVRNRRFLRVYKQREPGQPDKTTGASQHRRYPTRERKNPVRFNPGGRR